LKTQQYVQTQCSGLLDKSFGFESATSGKATEWVVCCVWHPGQFPGHWVHSRCGRLQSSAKGTALDESTNWAWSSITVPLHHRRSSVLTAVLSVNLQTIPALELREPLVSGIDSSVVFEGAADGEHVLPKPHEANIVSG
jgi:hypothetical protein